MRSVNLQQRHQCVSSGCQVPRRIPARLRSDATIGSGLNGGTRRAAGAAKLAPAPSKARRATSLLLARPTGANGGAPAATGGAELAWREFLDIAATRISRKPGKTGSWESSYRTLCKQFGSVLFSGGLKDFGEAFVAEVTWARPSSRRFGLRARAVSASPAPGVTSGARGSAASRIGVSASTAPEVTSGARSTV